MISMALSMIVLCTVISLALRILIHGCDSKASESAKDFIEKKKQAKDDHAEKIIKGVSQLMPFLLSETYSHEKMLRDKEFMKIVTSVKFAYENQYTKV